MEALIGKTIKSIEEPDTMKIKDGNYETERNDCNYLITFTDGTILKLASWDYEGYSSGIYKEIITS